MRQVIGVMDDMGGVIAFEHEYELEVITEVVLSQTQTMGQIPLIITTGYTTDEAHLRIIVETYPIQRLDERESRVRACDEEPAVVFERMPFFRYLQAARHGFRYNQLEGTIRAGTIDLIAAQDSVAVEHKACLRHWDSREII